MVKRDVADLTDADYRRLLAFRTGLRRFMRWSEQQALDAGLTHMQHQLLLAVRGHPDVRGPRIIEVADYLLLKHNSVVELVDRVEAMELIRRVKDEGDRRVVRLNLTEAGAQKLLHISSRTLAELQRMGASLRALSEGLEEHSPDGKMD